VILRTMNPRTIAGAARGTVIVGSGLALGALSAHFYTDAVVAENAEQPAPVSAAATKPKVVTVVRKRHVPSDPIIVYREVPVYGSGSSGGSFDGGSSSGGTWSGSGSSGSSSSGGGSSNVAPAPAPAPAPAKQPAASSGAS
jgi:uncharacterized membrane protein YgcG